MAKAVGLPFVKIESNMGEFYDDTLRMRITHTTRDAAAEYLLRNGIGVSHYSAGVHFSNVKVDLNRFGMGCFDTIALPILSTRDFEIIAAGALSRRAR